jgi:hypothetical protein
VILENAAQRGSFYRFSEDGSRLETWHTPAGNRLSGVPLFYLVLNEESTGENTWSLWSNDYWLLVEPWTGRILSKKAPGPHPAGHGIPANTQFNGL